MSLYSLVSLANEYLTHAWKLSGKPQLHQVRDTLRTQTPSLPCCYLWFCRLSPGLNLLCHLFSVICFDFLPLCCGFSRTHRWRLGRGMPVSRRSDEQFPLFSGPRRCLGHYTLDDSSQAFGNCYRRSSNPETKRLHCSSHMDLVTTKPVFGVSYKARLTPVSSATETS